MSRTNEARGVAFQVFVSRAPYANLLPEGEKTTFWQDFGIAERFGMGAVKDTFERAFKEWRDDVVYLAELALCLNHKCWQWHGGNDDLSRLYCDLWERVNDYAYGEGNLTEEQVDYYFSITD